jgi:hypothetical protein
VGAGSSSEGAAAALEVEAGLAGGVGAGEGAAGLDAGAAFDAGGADESARAAERVDKDIKAAALSAMAEIRGTL